MPSGAGGVNKAQEEMDNVVLICGQAKFIFRAFPEL